MVSIGKFGLAMSFLVASALWTIVLYWRSKFARRRQQVSKRKRPMYIPVRWLQIVGSLAIIGIYLVALYAINAKRLESSCTVVVRASSDIVAYVHCRAMWKPSGSTEMYKPAFQDLFHEWTITVNPTRSAAQIIVYIRDAQKPLDIIKVDPPISATVSATSPGWVSGFEEPTQLPDFYVRTVTFTDLDRPATITLRKPIKSRTGANNITNLDLNLDRRVEASAGKCRLDILPLPPLNSPESRSHFNDLTVHLNALISQKVTNEPAPTRLDPDEPYPPLAINESENVMELKCADSPCSRMTLTMQERTRIR
jgi:hypothetical protein